MGVSEVCIYEAEELMFCDGIGKLIDPQKWETVLWASIVEIGKGSPRTFATSRWIS